MHLFADGFTRVSLSAGVLRLTLVQTTGENETHEVGELLLPIVRAESFAQGLTNALQRISDQIRQEQQGGGEGNS